MKTVTIMRGVPGSGKSTFIANHAPEGAVVCSADHFFTSPDGEYHYDESKIREAHDACFAKFVRAVADGVRCIYVDNTNSRRWEFERYTNLANELGYRVYEVMPVTNANADELAARCVHGVSADKIQNMLDRFEN